jgi:prolyl-tRNA synthetase
VEFGSHVLAVQGESKRISMTAQEAVSQVKDQLIVRN